ncbi:MAG: thioredoxin [Candidatus Sericytochromatia bacterium]|nr:thioredoxin [Candidatus Sericytochromatia bacterium]
MDHEIVTCPSCKVRNRVADRPGKPRCAACRTPLARPSAAPGHVGDATFQARVLQAAEPVLVDVWAAWCGPCRMLAPVLERVARRFAGQLRVVKLNADENPATAAALGVQGLPTLLLFKRGEVVRRQAGFMPETALVQWLEGAGLSLRSA